MTEFLRSFFMTFPRAIPVQAAVRSLVIWPSLES
jgi:hypothetical protein